MTTYFAIDSTLCRSDERRVVRPVGILTPHIPTEQTRRHAEKVNPPLGEFAQLTGTIYVLGVPDGHEFFEVR